MCDKISPHRTCGLTGGGKRAGTGERVSTLCKHEANDASPSGRQKKNIVICCDGTGNEFGDANSNVIKLYSTLVINQSQVGYYHPGVGTMGAPTARTRIEKTCSRIKGLAFGGGLLDNVADAYRYLMDVYADGDDIYLFGFSRGAYTVRVLGEKPK